MARDMPEPCEFPSQDSCPKRFLWAHKAVGLVLQVGEALGLVLQVGEALGLGLQVGEALGLVLQVGEALGLVLQVGEALGLVLQVGEALGLVLQVGEALGLESLDRFLRVCKQGPRLTAAAEDGSDSNRDLYSLNLHAKLMVLLSPDPF